MGDEVLLTAEKKHPDEADHTLEARRNSDERAFLNYPIANMAQTAFPAKAKAEMPPHENDLLMSSTSINF